MAQPKLSGAARAAIKARRELIGRELQAAEQAVHDKARAQGITPLAVGYQAVQERRAMLASTPPVVGRTQRKISGTR